MKRASLRPELWLPWLTVLGFGSYIVSWAGREAFYDEFGVTPEIVGVDYPTLLIPAAVVGAFLVLILTAIVALASPALKRLPRRVALVQVRVGLVVFLAAFGLLLGIQVLRGSLPDRGPGLLLSMPVWFGGLLFLHGVSALSDTQIQRYQMRRLRRKRKPEEAMLAYIKQRRQRRRRQRARRNKLARAVSDILPAALPLLLSMTILLFISFAACLINAGEHAARNIVLSRKSSLRPRRPSCFGAVNVQVRSVRVIAIAPQFRPLEKTNLLYLGASSGSYVLYDRTARQAMLVPSGSVALRFR